MTETIPLPVVDGRALRTDRCVAEFAVHAFGVPVIRGALPALAGEVRPGTGPGDLELDLTLDATALRSSPPLTGRRITGPRLLHAAEHDVVCFTSTGSRQLGGGRLRLLGRLRLGPVPARIALHGRVFDTGDGATILHLTGALPLYEVRADQRGGMFTRVALLFAGEFAR